MKRSVSQDVIRNSFYNFATTISGRIGGLIFSIILARILLPSDFGIYSLAISIALILLTPIDTGANSTLLKYSSKTDSKGTRESRAYFKYILKLKLFLSFFLAIIILILSYPLSIFVFKKPDLFIPLIITSVYLILLSTESFFSSLFFIYNDVKILFFKETVFQILRIVAILLLPIIFIRTFFVPGTIFSLVFSITIILLLVISITRIRYVKLFDKSDFDITNTEKNSIKKYIFYIAAGGITAMIFSYVDILMIGIFIPDSSYIGYYRAATTLVFSIAGILSFSNVLIPKFAQLNKNNLEISVNKILKYTIMFGIPANFGLLIIGKYLIRAIYGYAYIDSFYPLFALSFLITIAIISGTLYSILSAKGRPEIYTKASTISLILNIILNYTLINFLIKVSYLWAIIGAAIATLISYTIYVSILAIFVKKHFEISIHSNLFIKPLIASVLMSMILIFINSNISDMTIILGVFEIIFGIIIYFSLMFIMKGFNKDDLKFFKLKNMI